MPTICLGGANHFHEECGEGSPLVFIHGAFADARMWEPQWRHFANKHRLVRYDLRGHGRTGASSLERYSMATFADDLADLLEALDLQAPVLCGQSFGGSIALACAVRHPGKVRGLIAAGSMAAVDLTLMDKILCRVLFPGWAMEAVIGALSVEKFTHFSLWLGRLTKGKQFLSADESVTGYLQECMQQMDSREYLKIWRALYGFRLLPLERVSCPALILNGEKEPRSMLPHREVMLRRIPHAQGGIIPDARHASNLDNARLFNQFVEDFLASLGV